MGSCSNVAVKIIFKLLSFLFIIWIMCSLGVIKDYSLGDDDPMVLEKNDAEAIKRFMKNNENKTISKITGDKGRPVILKDNVTAEINSMIRSGWTEQAYKKFVSDIIPVNRSLYDTKDEWCLKQRYSTNLPTATVIIPFSGEASSILIRTVTSVLNRSPQHLLDEIILVDDSSTLSILEEPLRDYFNAIPKVSIMHTPNLLGAINSSLFTISRVKSPVIVFLSSHYECGDGWLEPLLQRIHEKPTRVVSPVINTIDSNTFNYYQDDFKELILGGSSWDLKYSAIEMPKEVFEKRLMQKKLSTPIETPTLPGLILATNKKIFTEIVFYETQMKIWNVKNIESSLKTWMCGRSMEIVPCSHVGVIAKNRFSLEPMKKLMKENTDRVAEVGLDIYAKYYHKRVVKLKGHIANASRAKDLRRELNCKPFNCDEEKVYSKLEMPDKFAARGQIYTASNSNLCLDANLEDISKQNCIVKFSPCHLQGGSQYFLYAPDGEIRHDQFCLDYIFAKVVINFCNKLPTQLWLYSGQDQLIRHKATNRCLDIHYNNEPVLAVCGNNTQKWLMDNFNFENLTSSLKYYIKNCIVIGLKKCKENDRILYMERLYREFKLFWTRNNDTIPIGTTWKYYEY